MSWGVTAVVAIGISAAVSGYSMYAQTQAANAAADFESRVARRNADMAEMQAKDALERGKVAEKQLRDKQKMLIGQQRAGFGASGVLVDQDTTMDVMQDSIKFGEQDALTTRRNAAMDAWGYRTQGLNYQAQADLSQMSKRNATTAGTLSFLGSAAGSVASIAGSKAGASGSSSSNSSKSSSK
jgi:hypothetical protein